MRFFGTHACLCRLEKLSVSRFWRIQVRVSSNTKGLKRGWKRSVRLARITLTPRFTDFFTDFEKKNPTVLQSTISDIFDTA